MTRLTWSRTSCAATSTSFSSAEGDEHLRHAFGRDRAQLVDAADGVDRLLDLVGDLGLDLLRARRPGRRVMTTTTGKSTLGNRSTPSWKYPRADDADDEDEHRRENGPLDADLREPLHGSVLPVIERPAYSTRDPSLISLDAVSTTCSPGLTPWRTATTSPSCSPVSTMRSSIFLFCTTNTRRSDPSS